MDIDRVGKFHCIASPQCIVLVSKIQHEIIASD